MNDLKLFFVAFSVHKEREWVAHAGYLFVREGTSIHDILTEKYGEVRMLSMQWVRVTEGTILYGSGWRMEN